jgi:hypothetical protein
MWLFQNPKPAMLASVEKVRYYRTAADLAASAFYTLYPDLLASVSSPTPSPTICLSVCLSIYLSITLANPFSSSI